MTEEEALAAARAAAEAKGWPFVDPVLVLRKRPWFRKQGGTWEVVTNRFAIGGNVRVTIDDATGAVLEAGFLPR
jgi:hypothetical protein